MEKELQEWHKLHKFYLYMGEYETKDLADYLKVNPRTVQRWLREKAKPGKGQLALIRRYLTERESNISL